MSKKSFIDSVKVASACGENWEQMEGNDRVRFCSHCSKSVNNLSEMTRKEATRFVRKAGDTACIRYFTVPGSDRPVFADQFLQITRRAPSIAAGVMTASVALSSQAYGQSVDPNSPWPSANPPAQIMRDPVKKGEADAAQNTIPRSLSGTVLDPNGAVIAGASLKVTSIATGLIAETTSSSDGEYTFHDLESGKYSLVITSPGFKTTTTIVDMQPAGQTENGALEVEGVNVTVDVHAELGLEVATVGGMGIVEYSSPLSSAIADEDVDLVRELLAKGAKVNAKEEDYGKITPLFVAVETGNIDIVQMLLAHGARPNARDDSKQTPLWRLDEDATPELVSMLLRAGARANLTDDEGRTALIHLARRATPEVLQAIIDAGADVNHADNEGTTALIAAADAEELENVRILLIAGATVNAMNNEGDTAFDRAESEEIQKLLISYGSTGKIKTEAKPDNEN